MGSRVVETDQVFQAWESMTWDLAELAQTMVFMQKSAVEIWFINPRLVGTKWPEAPLSPIAKVGLVFMKLMENLPQKINIDVEENPEWAFGIIISWAVKGWVTLEIADSFQWINFLDLCRRENPALAQGWESRPGLRRAKTFRCLFGSEILASQLPQDAPIRTVRGDMVVRHRVNLQRGIEDYYHARPKKPPQAK